MKKAITCISLIFVISLFPGCGCDDSSSADQPATQAEDGDQWNEEHTPHIVPDIFVSKSGNDSTGDGSNENPYLTIAKAVSIAQTDNTIGVSKGTYNEYILIDKNIHIYGSWKEDFTIRNTSEHTTIITESRTGAGGAGDPQATVKFDGASVTRNAIIDGFVIYAGVSVQSAGVSCLNSASPTISNCTINGGSPTGYSFGIFTGASCDAYIYKNIINGGTGSNSYAIYNLTSWPEINSNVINGSNGSNGSFGIYNSSTGQVIIINNTIHGGNGPTQSIGIVMDDSAGSIKWNTINGGASTTSSTCIYNDVALTLNIYGNILINSGTSTRRGIYNISTTPTVTYNCIYVTGDTGTSYGTADGNLTLNPYLGGDDGMSPTTTSPSDIAEGVHNGARGLEDKNGMIRSVPYCSMGAYEFRTRPDLAIHVSPDGDDETGDGSKGTPYKTITKAISEADSTKKIIQVAAGEYKENLEISKTVELYGGWNSDFSARNPEVNYTAIIDNRTSENETNTILINDSSEIIIDGFAVLINTASTSCKGIRIIDSENIIISKNYIHNLNSDGEETLTGIIMRGINNIQIMCNYFKLSNWKQAIGVNIFDYDATKINSVYIYNNIIFFEEVSTNGTGIMSLGSTNRPISLICDNNIIVFYALYEAMNMSICFKLRENTTMTIRNNIAIERDGLQSVAVSYAGDNNTYTAMNNNFYIENNIGVDLTGTDGNINVDPKLGGVNGFYFTADSPASVTEGGTVIPEVEFDKDGVTREDPYSMGAYELRN